MSEVFVNVYQDGQWTSHGAAWPTREKAKQTAGQAPDLIYRLRVLPKPQPTPKWEDMP